MRDRYEIRWGDSRGNSEALELTGALQSEIVIAMARGLNSWYRKQPNYTRERRFVEVRKIEEVTNVTPIYEGGER